MLHAEIPNDSLPTLTDWSCQLYAKHNIHYCTANVI